MSAREPSVVMRERYVSSSRVSRTSSVFLNMENESTDPEDTLHTLHENILRCESNISNKLHRAVSISCYQSCKKHLDEGMDINSVDEIDGSNALHILCLKSRKGDPRTLDIAKLFVERGAELDAKDLKGNTPLHIAAREGLKDVCNVLIDQAEKAEKPLVNNLNGKRMTALHVAVQQRQCEVVELLLKRGAKPNVKDYISFFPIHYAVENGCHRCCRALAPFYEGDATLTKRQESPLMIAARKGYCKTIKAIPVEKINVNYKDSDGNTALHIAAKKGFDNFLVYLLDLGAAPDTLNSSGWTPLMSAVAKEKAKCAKVLMERGAALSVKSIDKESNILHIATASKSHHCLEHLLKNDEVMKLIDEKNKDDYTPLALAVQRKSDKCIKLLEEAGASPFIGDEVRASIIYNSPGYRGTIILHERLVREKNVTFTNESKMTPLHIAAQEGNVDACKALLRRGARIDPCDKYGRTPLLWAAFYGYESILKLLLKKKASRRAKDDKKYTALHCAAFSGKLQCCKVLLETDRGLIKEKDKKGKYALDVAHDQGRFDVFIFLLEKFSKRSINIPDDLTERFHSYVHQMLSAKKESLLEAVVRSNWWEAGFGLVGKRLHGEAPCLLFRDTIKVFPELAYNIMTKCHSRRDFRLLEDNFGVEKATPTTTPNSGHKEDANGTVQGATKTQEEGKSTKLLTCDGMTWKRQHPIYTMASRENSLPLLQHPLTKAWVAYKWQTYACYIFTLLMILRAVTIVCLVSLLCYLRHLIQLDQKYKDAVPLEKAWVPAYILVPMGLSVGLQELEGLNRMIRLKDHWLIQLMQVLWPTPTIITLLTLLTRNTIKAYFCGIAALVLTGMEFVFRIDHLPSFNILTSITQEFLRKYLKGLLFATYIIALFAFIFYLLFLDEKEFRSIPHAVLSIAFWQMGDFNQEIFFKEITFPVISHVLFIVYLCTFGAFIVTLIQAPSTTREAFFLNKKMKMINLIFYIDICFPWIRKCYKTGLLSDRGESSQNLIQKGLGDFWKTWEEIENEAPGDGIPAMFRDKCKRCGVVCTCEDKSERRSSGEVTAHLEALTQEIKSLQFQINLLQQGMNK